MESSCLLTFPQKIHCPYEEVCYICLQAQRPQTKSRKALTVRAQNAPDIKLIASDVDGTLLDSQQKLSPKVVKAVQLCRSIGIQVSRSCSRLAVWSIKQ